MTWYAIRTNPQREFLLAGRYDENGEWRPGVLEKKGYDQVFCPTETKFRKTIKKGRLVWLFEKGKLALLGAETA